MLVTGNAKIQVDISYDEAMKIVLKELGYQEDYCLLDEKGNENSNTPIGKEKIYSWEDISHHGSPQYEYKEITDDQGKVYDFKLALILLKRNREKKNE